MSYQTRLQNAIKTLEHHNKWRRGVEGVDMLDPKKVGEAIDAVLPIVRSYVDVMHAEEKDLCTKKI